MIQAATAGCFFHKTAPPGRSHFSGGAVFDLRLDLHNWKSASIRSMENTFICEDGTLGIIGDYSDMVNEVSRLRSEYDLAVYKLTEFRMDHPDVEVR